MGEKVSLNGTPTDSKWYHWPQLVHSIQPFSYLFDLFVHLLKKSHAA